MTLEKWVEQEKPEPEVNIFKYRGKRYLYLGEKSEKVWAQHARKDNTGFGPEISFMKSCEVQQDS